MIRSNTYPLTSEYKKDLLTFKRSLTSQSLNLDDVGKIIKLANNRIKTSQNTKIKVKVKEEISTNICLCKNC